MTDSKRQTEFDIKYVARYYNLPLHTRIAAIGNYTHNLVRIRNYPGAILSKYSFHRYYSINDVATVRGMQNTLLIMLWLNFNFDYD